MEIMEGNVVNNFTKGPWYVVAGNENHGPYVTSDHADNNDICDLYHKNDYDDGFHVKQGAIKSIDNANLIAAAPDMYEALTEICQEFAHGHPSIVKGRKALAKAKGKTQ